ncbi:MAG: ISL3 family transposase [Myxococcota bacterium]|jgi:transposase|nr:ISL3 family transposase [Myxococcota bacterium]
MSTSLLYHAFGATAHDYLRTEYWGGAVHFHLETKASRLRCAECGSAEVSSKGRVKCMLRALPIGFRPVFLVLWLRVLFCDRCKRVRQERRRLADQRKSYTRAFARLVLSLAGEMALSSVANLLQVRWSVVRDIVKGDLDRRAERLSLAEVRCIAIDEFAIRKGHRYATVVVEMLTGQVLFCVEGRDHTCLKAFFDRLAESGAKLEAVAVDMSGAYGKAIELFAPGMPIVFDRFHVVSRMNEALDDLRRSEQNRLEGEGSARSKAHATCYCGPRRTSRRRPRNRPGSTSCSRPTSCCTRPTCSRRTSGYSGTRPTSRRLRPSSTGGSRRPGNWAPRSSRRSPRPSRGIVSASSLGTTTTSPLDRSRD